LRPVIDKTHLAHLVRTPGEVKTTENNKPFSDWNSTTDWVLMDADLQNN
jgi:hypothetical protein